MMENNYPNTVSSPPNITMKHNRPTTVLENSRLLLFVILDKAEAIDDELKLIRARDPSLDNGKIIMNVVNSMGHTMLHKAAEAQRHYQLQWMLEELDGTSDEVIEWVNARELSGRGDTALHLAVRNRDLASVLILRAFGGGGRSVVDANIGNLHGETARELARKNVVEDYYKSDLRQTSIDVWVEVKEDDLEEQK
ncbi:hypothetical protein B0H67DRAFT_553746 [Lasiosphaeris hirsuta]|uniref:Uncharacterized protein n=1 Tax=Lasiosphaeris hirsuta TaxID=260670 RepID=A0AA40AG56_9PEZI|nr:hypothetical protein B0H67DRAFT_553746 [Lasiosphaeris hirsuta]